jgi:hypothetical protein
MAIYFDQNNKMVFDCRDSSKVINNNCPTIPGLNNFDGNAYVLLRPGSTSNSSGNKTFKWDMWLDMESGYTSNTSVFCFWPASGYQLFGVHLDNNHIFIDTNWSPMVSQGYPLSGFSSTILHCEVKKAGSSITYFKINSNSQISSGNGNFGGSSNAWYIGYSAPALYNTTVWNISVINDDTSTETDKFIGYPAGNTAAAWVNLYNTGTPAIIFSPDGTRNIG